MEEGVFRGLSSVVDDNEPVVPASEMVEALRRTKQLEDALGPKVDCERRPLLRMKEQPELSALFWCIAILLTVTTLINRRSRTVG